MASLRDLINSRTPEEEERLKQESIAFQKKMGMEDAPEEGGINEWSGNPDDLAPNTDYEREQAGHDSAEEDTSPGTKISDRAMFGGTRMGKLPTMNPLSAEKAVAKQEAKTVGRLKDSGVPPLWAEVGPTDDVSKAKQFAGFVRGEEAASTPAAGAASAAPKAAKKEVLNEVRFSATNKPVRALQDERMMLDLKTDAGRDRLKEIDRLLKQRVGKWE